MFLTTHAAAGMAISRYVDDPVAVFCLAFASHFVLDFIPHGDERLYHDHEWKVLGRYRRALLVSFFDILALVGLILIILRQTDLPDWQLMNIGILGSVLPDFLSHLFPVIHRRGSWLFLIRWLYKATKPTGIRYLVRAQNWLHEVLHHEIIRRDIPLSAGIMMQVILVFVFLSFIR